MEEELCKLGSSLSIQEEETTCIVESDGAWINENEDHTLMLLGRVFTKRSVHFDALFTTLTQAMHPVKGMTTSRVGTDRFLIKFHHRRDFNRALETTPYNFEKYPVILSPLTGEDNNLATMDLNHCDYYIHVHGLPLNRKTEAMARFVGNKIGIFRNVDFDLNGKARPDTLRIRVGILLTAPLKRFLKIKTPNGTDLFLSFTYERLSNFCYVCGMCDHTDRYCEKPYDDESDTDPPVQEFGAWLRDSQSGEQISKRLPGSLVRSPPAVHPISSKLPGSPVRSPPAVHPISSKVGQTLQQTKHEIVADVGQKCYFSAPYQGGESFFRNILGTMETVYLNRNPTAKAILDLVRSVDDDRICYDHFAFRTFGVNGHGIDSMAKVFLDFGYVQREELRFPAKKLKAFWFSPPDIPNSNGGEGVNGPLPRIFISELLVDQMTPEAQKIIEKYTKLSGNGKTHAALASALGSLTWEKPSFSEFKQLARESEYAAWTLVNGYALNHVTISTHRLKSRYRNIRNLNQFIEENGFKLNSEGGILKVSPDGLLLQSSTVADSDSFEFAEGNTESIPRSYFEFAERLVLPQFKDLPENKVEEFHRRDGFEVGNADKIFESTSKDQLTRNVA